MTAPLQQPDINTGLKAWISRPYKIRVATIDLSSAINISYPMQPQTTTEVSTPFMTLDFPGILMNVPGIIQKINNHRYGRFSIKIKLTINATPYSQGSLLLVYSPLENTVTGTSRSILTCGAPSLTSYPGIMMDINQTTSAEITLPFNSYKDYYDLLSSEDMNTISLYGYVLTRLSDPTITAFTVTVWATICDLELAGYTPNSVWTPPSGDTPPDEDDPNNVPDNEQYPTMPGTVTASLQINGRNTGAPAMASNGSVSSRPSVTSGQTEGAAGNGALSNIARGISNVSTGLSAFPLLSTYTKPIAWFSDLVAKGLTAVGLSKPNTDMPVRPTVDIPTFGNTHGTGVFNGVKLGISQSNALEGPSDAFMTDMDEMDISYICAQPGVISNIPFSNVRVAGEVLQTIPVTATYVPNTFNAIHHKHLTLMEFISTNFAYWSGTIVYTLKIMKTPFHNGKLVVSYNPNYLGITDEYSENYSHHVYFDIAERDSIQIRIPVLYNQSWIPTNAGFPNQFGQIDYLTPMAYSIGNMQIRVVNPLVAPDTVNNSVDILVWKHGENMEFCVPYRSPFPISKVTDTAPTDTQFVAWTTFPGFLDIPPADRNNEIEGELQINLSNTIQDPHTVTFNAETNDINKKLSMCIGERISNMRVLVHQVTPDQAFTPDESKYWFFYAQDNFTNPSDFGGSYDQWPNQTAVRSHANMTYISNIYRYWRGGINVLAEAFNNNGSKIYSTVFPASTIVTSGSVGTTFASSSRSAHVTEADKNGFHQISVPFYSTAMRVPIVRDGLEDTRFPRLFTASLALRVDSLIGTTAASASMRFSKSGDDDFSFGFLIGPSPILVPQLVSS